MTKYCFWHKLLLICVLSVTSWFNGISAQANIQENNPPTGGREQEHPSELGGREAFPPELGGREAVPPELEGRGAEKFVLIPVGLNLGDKNVLPSSFVRGYEDGSQAVDFDNWLIPFDDVVKALKFKVTTLDSGEIELRNQGLAVKIKSDELIKDPEIGLTLSVAQIKTLLKIPTEFNLNEYAIVFRPGWLALKDKTRFSLEEEPIILDGLPVINPPNWSISTIRQDLDLEQNSRDNILNNQSRLSAIGTLVGGSWYFNLNQPDLEETNSWSLNELQYLLQKDNADYVVGSHPTFWSSQGEGDFWGLTTIQRFGNFQTQAPTGSSFNPQQRLYSQRVNRSISGEAKPGTLVQLTTRNGKAIIKEVLVDASGFYSFDIPTGLRGVNDVQVLLYPDGQLSATPEVREIEYTTLQGQLSKGDSAIIASAGYRRQSVTNNIIGEFNDFRGGVSYRLGLTDDLTVGVGVVPDNSLFGVGEVYYQPAGLPLKIGLSTLLGDTEENSRRFNADIDLDFERLLRLRLLVSEDSQGFNLSTGFIPNLSFRVGGNTSDNTLSAGLNYTRSFPQGNISAGFDLYSDGEVRWTFNSLYRPFRVGIRANKNNFSSELIYYLSNSLANGHSLVFNYDTRNSDDDNDYLASVAWRYVSETSYQDGRNLWDVELGYGMGSRGNGLIAEVSTPILRWLSVGLVYEQVSLDSNESRFRLQLHPNLNLTPQPTPADYSSDYLRSQGGMLIQPFFDLNGNSQKDRGEKVYTDSPELLVLINNKDIRSLRPFVTEQGIFIRLPPQTYRLDLDPAGYPIDWSTPESAYAVKVVAGSYTKVLVPFNLSYVVAGTVTNSEGNVIQGATVEAIPNNPNDKKRLSITNRAGIFYLEELKQGKYQLLINGKPAQPNTLELNQNSPPVTELNLLLP
jgi:hypothetical protein